MNKRSLYIFISALLLASCGGGGGGGSEPSAPAPQNITVSLTSSAASVEVNSSITLTWSSTLATSCSASGAWSGSKGTSGSESITIGVGGSNTFSLSCSASGANSGSASTTVNGLRYFDGKVFDGYIRGAEVFVDTNDNFTLDSDESSVTTDNLGSFTKLLYNDGTLVSIGGIDSDTGADLSSLTLAHKLMGFEESKLASPFTTLIAYMSDASTINAALGIDASIDLLTTDPIPNLGEGIYDLMYEKGNQLTVLAFTLQNHAGSVNGNSQLYFQAIADQLEESYAVAEGTVNIEDPTFISKLIDKVETARDVTFSSDVKANLNTVLSSVIPIIAVNSDMNITTAVQRFAFSTLQNDVQDSTVMIGNASPTLLKYENNIYDYVASDQGIDQSAINPPPVITSAATFDAPENQVFIGKIIASDPDNEPLTFSIKNVQGNVPGDFMSISTTGELNFIGGIPNYEGVKKWTATVVVSDGISSVEQNITVNITNVNEAPWLGFRRTKSEGALSRDLLENEEYVGRIDETDCAGCSQNEDDDVTYSISKQKLVCGRRGVYVTYEEEIDLLVLNNDLTITIDNGIDVESFNQVTFDGSDCWLKDVWLDFTLKGNDGVFDGYHDQILPVSNQSDTLPVYESPRVISVDECASSSSTCPNSRFYIDVFDQDGDSLTYELGGADSDKLRIYSTACQPHNYFLMPDKYDRCGEVSFQPRADYETQSQYNITVLIGDPGVENYPALEKELTININDIDETIPNEEPMITSSGTFSAAENQTAIGSVTATDADGDSLTYSISGSEINISSSGVLTFATAPDYETKSSYTATVTVSDGTASATQDITVNVTDVSENTAPTFTSSATFSAAENQTAIGTVTATDADGDSLTYSISGSEINISSSGVLTFATAPDYETKSSYTATVTVSDGTASATQDITVTVTDVDEVVSNQAPTISGLAATIDVQEGETDAYQVNASDPEGDTIYYAISGNDSNLFTINNSGLIQFKSAPDYENPADANQDNLYDISVSVSDQAPSGSGSGLSPLSFGIQPLNISNTSIRVTNYDEDIISLSLSSSDGTSSVAPTISLNLEIDSYTNPTSVSILYEGPGGAQYWTNAGAPQENNFKLIYQYTFDAPLTSPSGEWRIRTIKLNTASAGYIDHLQTYLNSKGFTTTTNIYNSNSDENDPELVSISSVSISGNDSNPSTSIVLEFSITANDSEGGYEKGHSRWEAPGNEGGWPYQGGWGSTNLNTNPPTTTFTATLDPKTVSGLYKLEDIRLYDKAGNRKFFYCNNYDGTYLVKSNDETIGACSINIDNPIQDNSKPVLTAFSITGAIDSGTGRKKILHSLEIDNETSWTNQETGLRRMYLRILGPNGFRRDIYDGSLGFSGETLLPLDADAGEYYVNYFFVTDNALNENKYFQAELNNLGFTTSVTFD